MNTAPPADQLCDKCRGPLNEHHWFFLCNPILGNYFVCDGCSLALENFIDAVDKRVERRAKSLIKDVAQLGER